MILSKINNQNKKRCITRGNNGQNVRAGGFKLKRGMNKRWLAIPKLSTLKPKAKKPAITLNILLNKIGNKNIKTLTLDNLSRRFSNGCKVLPCVKRYLKENNVVFTENV